MRALGIMNPLLQNKIVDLLLHMQHRFRINTMLTSKYHCGYDFMFTTRPIIIQTLYNILSLASKAMTYLSKT